MGWRLGYKRVSTVDQATDRQLDGMTLDRTYEDKASGRDHRRPQLTELRRTARDGDTVVVHSIDRLARNLMDLKKLVTEFNANGVAVEFVKERLTFTGKGEDAQASLMLNVMGAFAEFERSLIAERQREGIAKAKQRTGPKRPYKGRAPSLSPLQHQQLVVQLSGTKMNRAELARHFKISRSTLYTYIRSIEARQAQMLSDGVVTCAQIGTLG